MENFYLAAIVTEIRSQAMGKTLSKVFLSGSDFLFDFRLPGSALLRASVDQASPALYLSTGTMARDAANASDPFLALLRKNLTGARLTAIAKHPRDRILRFDFEQYSAGGDKAQWQLLLALTGRAANIYLRSSAGMPPFAYFERDEGPLEFEFPAGDQAIDSGELLRSIGESASRDEISAKYFGRDSIFGPALKAEFEARSEAADPRAAFASLLADLFGSEPRGLVYSRGPLEEVGTRPLRLKSDLLLSSLALVQAAGLMRRQFPTLSEAADRYYEARERAKTFEAEYNAIKQALSREIKKREELLKAVGADLTRHGEPEQLKRYGDLILANIATAQIRDRWVTVVDYYDPTQPHIEIEKEENQSLQQAAADYFRRYQKARRALTAIAERQGVIGEQLAGLKNLLSELEQDPGPNRIAAVRAQFERGVKSTSRGSAAGAKPERKQKRKTAPGRRFKSQEGFEVLVGRNDRDNDYLTFRVARSQDIWLHAADYPGSHVIVRNPGRDPVPHHVVVEAAETAAFYSQAKREGKAAVHYTQKKSVSKPPKAKPGLVRLSDFKTLMVEPRCRLERIE